MSTATMAEPHECEAPRILTPMPAANKPARPAVLRRGNREQGRALEALGHAIEYLVDSRMFGVRDAGRRAEAQAIQILMLASRSVFEECAEVVPIRRRVLEWVEHRLFPAA